MRACSKVVCCLLLGMGMLCVLSCGHPMSAAVTESRIGIAELRRLGTSCRGRLFKEKSLRVCGRIDAISDSRERAAVLRELADCISSMPVRCQSVLAVERMAHEFWQPFEFVAYRLARNGFPESEVGDFIIAGFGAYRDVCRAFDAGGSRVEFNARERRRLARGLRHAWEDDVRFFESHSIDMIFTTPSAATRFRKRWRSSFGLYENRSAAGGTWECGKRRGDGLSP